VLIDYISFPLISYLHRLKIIKKNGIQTVDHLILVFQCERLKNERDILKNNVLKKSNWPLSKSELINRNFKQFIIQGVTGGKGQTSGGCSLC